MSTRRSFFETPGPTVAVEVTSTRISAASVVEQGGRQVVSGHASEPLPHGAVVPSLNSSNIVDQEAVVTALGRVLINLGSRPRRIGLILPDSMAKVSLVRFEKIPPRVEDLDQLVRWQVRKTAPFKIEDAQLSYTPGMLTGDGGREFIVSMARRDIVAEYEAVCAAAGAHAGIVDLATFNVINTVLAATPAASSDWLLVHVAPGYTTVAIVRGEDLIFFRNRPEEEEGSLADLVHQSAMYYEDRLGGGGFSRALVTGAGHSSEYGDIASLSLHLQERLGCPVQQVDASEVAPLTSRVAAGPEILDVLAPLVGLLIRERAA